MNRFPSLECLINDADWDLPLNICIVTPDIVGPVKNGGIGTACTYLAYALAETHHRVHILFTPQGTDESTENWQANYKAKGISLTVIDTDRPEPIRYFPGSRHLITSLYVYDWLSAHDIFDLIIFMDLYGNAFYSLCAKRSGIKFLNSSMVLIVHSPTLWHTINNISLTPDPIQSCTWHIERRCIEMADALISPSSYMLQWCSNYGYKIGENAFVQPNPLFLDNIYTSDNNINEIVFFGRLEYRKGIKEFCDALDILAKEKKLPSKITFLGKCAWVGNEHSLGYIGRRMSKWEKSDITILIDKNHKEALHYLSEGSRVAIMPSVADNSPYVVYECVAAGIPFLARDTGGVKELLAPEDANSVLFGDNPHELADKIISLCGKPPHRISLAFDIEKNIKTWQSGLPALVDHLKRRPPRNAPEAIDDFISICVTHHNRSELLRQCIDSLLAQTHKNFEVILVDDGSDDAAALAYLKSLEKMFAKRGWQILRLPHAYVGRSRNIGAGKARGDWLLFLDDDNVAFPHMLETFVRSLAHSPKDLIVSSFYVFDSMDYPKKENIVERFLPVGDILSYSVITNVIGDTTSLIKKSTFFELGGFSEDYGVGHEDYELYLRFALANKEIGIIPDALFWYRRNEDKNSVQLSTDLNANFMRSMRPYMETLPIGLAEMALMCHGMGAYTGSGEVEKGGGRSSIMSPPSRDMRLDPQSDNALLQMFLYLEDAGNDTLAAQIADTMKLDNSHKKETVRLMSAMRKAAKAGNSAALQEDLKSYEKDPARLRGNTRIKLYASLLGECSSEKPPYQCARILINQLNKCVIKDIEILLHLSRHSLLIGDTKSALESFFKALNQAEEEYKKARPDVAQAIESGAFFCALQHYVLYGFKENTKWPFKDIFAKILRHSQQVFAYICHTHMLTHNYKDQSIAILCFTRLAQ